MRLRPARAGQNAPASLIAETDPRSPASEAYRALRTNIQFAGLDQPCRCIVVTSATAGEGKTTSVANFGAVCAQAGSRVCLVDSDLRRPVACQPCRCSSRSSSRHHLTTAKTLSVAVPPTLRARADEVIE